MLPTDRQYHYTDETNRNVIGIDDIVDPEGPIYIKRWNPENGGTPDDARRTSISTEMLARAAGAFSPGQPVNFERVYGSSYNTRSVLEALLAHTPQFSMCKPGRIDSYTGEIVEGHKHLMWSPNSPHPRGEIAWINTEIVVSEVSHDVTYDAVRVPTGFHSDDMDAAAMRRHTQMQINLLIIGKQFGYKTWIAQNDRGIIYQDKRLDKLDGVVGSLQNETVIGPFADAVRAALLIDCLWFKNGKLMPAVLEVEHSTGVTSGLTRMKGLQDALPSFLTSFVVVAPDSDRHKVVQEANREQFRSLNVRYFPYSAVEELRDLCQRRNIRGISQEFLDSWWEPVLSS